MAKTDIELLTRCAEFSLGHIHSVEEQIHKELETSGATRLVMALRLCRLQRAVVAAGTFSIFESLLQAAMSWKDAFVELDKYLRLRGEDVLADRIGDYYKAVNSLKHGIGKSHSKLLGRHSLEFEVKGPGDFFFDEGDVSEIGVLVDADDDFLRLGSELIEKVRSVIEAKEGKRI
jgi:hypothetical protein